MVDVLLTHQNISCWIMGSNEPTEPDDAFEAFIQNMSSEEEQLLQQGAASGAAAATTNFAASHLSSFEEGESMSPDRRVRQVSRDMPTSSPKQYDIICGRERISHAHFGNKRFRRVIEKNRERYQTAPSREAKTRISTELVVMLRTSRPGGRFLKMDPETGKWFDVGDDYARDKVSHALRSAKDPNRTRIRKKRKVIPKTFTDEENRMYESLLQDQQLVFKQLVDRYEEQEAEINLPLAVETRDFSGPGNLRKSEESNEEPACAKGTNDSGLP